MKIHSLRALIFALFCTFSFSSFAQQLDLNNASADQIATVLKGVGPAKAQAIVDYRQANGPFKTLDELVRVKGIGQATLQKNLDRITVAAPEQNQKVAVKE
ncbi:MAG: Fis family transcriptional regulator [Neptuniibacter caesariensis]|uniref:Fis family transcriptional regulator n=1 Tax=Neptuniibacter caesariensis TaxID=207954 RepID=A0A2G6JN54_NEPCE|nr:MAG: Fis family transcriptional regulator [Neptuniibacter caesariensis]